MRVSIMFAALSAGSLLFASPAYPQAQPKRSDLDTARELLKTDAAQSLKLVDRIIDEALAKDPEAICPGAAAAFLQSFMKGNFTVTVTVENDWCDALLVKGYALNELKRPIEAEAALKLLVGRAPANAQYQIEYAYTVRVNGDLPRALEVYLQAEKLASKLPDKNEGSHLRAMALRGQGFTLSDLKRWDEAVKAYKRSQKYEPDSEIARNELQYIEQNRPH